MAPRYCCVTGCHNNNKSNTGLHFYTFPSGQDPLSIKQREAWVQAIRRQGLDGNLWEPSKWATVCSAHFVSGQRSKDPSHPDWVPSVFSTGHRQPAPGGIERYERVAARNSRKSTPMESDFRDLPLPSMPTAAPSFYFPSKKNMLEVRVFVFLCLVISGSH